MIINDYQTRKRHKGQFISEEYNRLFRGTVRFYFFKELNRYAWTFTPDESKGDFMNTKSPETYDNFKKCSEGFNSWLANR